MTEIIEELTARQKKAAYKKAWAIANREKVIASQKAWATANREKAAAASRSWKEANPEKVSADNRAYYASHREERATYGRAYEASHKVEIAAATKARRAANPAASAEKCRSEQAAAANRRPSWYEKTSCVAVYQQARDLTLATGIKHQVDHVIPLQGEMVSGLHVAANLQVLTATANRLKHNSFMTI